MSEWRDIPSYEGIYQVSSCGRVRSIDRTIQCTNRVINVKGVDLKKTIGTHGYYFVVLSKESKTKTTTVHKLVAMCFLKNWRNGFLVDHIDENKLNNDYKNLQIANKSINNTKSHSHKNKKRGAYKRKWGWLAQITVKGRSIHLGYHKTKSMAHDAYYLKYLEIYGVKPWN